MLISLIGGHSIMTKSRVIPVLSLVVPCYNEEIAIPLFYKEALKTLSKIKGQVEFIFVDDGSRDNTLNILRQLANKNSGVHYISFSRNFGKEAAMLAGLEEARGQYVVMLDVDLQHPPELIPEMLAAVSSGEYDCAATIRTRQGDSRLRTFFSRCFYLVMQKLTGMDIRDGAGDFRLMSRKYVEAILSLHERNRFSKGIFPWVGFKIKWLEYENIARITGQTKWSFSKLFLYALNGITAFSNKLLGLASICGILSFFVSLLMIVFFVINKFIWMKEVDGWATIVCLITFFGGIQLLTVGILSQYSAKIYTEVKQRPHYIIYEKR